MSEIEIELDDDVAEMIREQAEKSGRTFDEQASVMIREALTEVVRPHQEWVSRATSDEPIPLREENPTA